MRLRGFASTIRSCYKGLCFAYLRRSVADGDGVCRRCFAPDECVFFFFSLWRGGSFGGLMNEYWPVLRLIRKKYVIFIIRDKKTTLVLFFTFISYGNTHLPWYYVSLLYRSYKNKNSFGKAFADKEVVWCVIVKL